MPKKRSSSRSDGSRLIFNKTAFNKKLVVTEIVPRFQSANDAGALYVTNNVAPIATGRLAVSARGIKAQIVGDRIMSGIQLGGVSIRGVYSEQTFERDVSYALTVEIRSPYLRPAIPQISEVILERLKQKQNAI